MQYFIQGKGEVNLTDKDFIEQGGEGKVYRKGQIVYKIYDHVKKMLPDAKIQELKALSLPNIIKPEDIILDKRNIKIGFTMPYVNGEPLSKLFTKDFRNRNYITNSMILNLIEKIKESITFIHKQNCLIVDGNEFNYLVSKDFITPYFIDVDSYQTPNFPAKAIKPQMKDWHAKTFTELSDWFSFALTACWLFVGIHPYRGKHSHFTKKKYGDQTLIERMKHNISIFNPNVNLPKAIQDFSLIPIQYKNWFISLFEKGERCPPPVTPGAIHITTIPIQIIKSSETLIINLIHEYEDDIIYFKNYGGIKVVKSKKKFYIKNTNYDVSSNVDIVFTPKNLQPVLLKIENKRLKLKSLVGMKNIFIDLEATDYMVIDNTIYIKNEGNLIELSLDNYGEKIMAPIKTIWNIMPHSSKLFKNIICQNVLEKAYLVIPLPRVPYSKCIIKPVSELDGYRIIDAKHDLGVCMLLGYKNNHYDKFIFKFDSDYINYNCRIIKNVDNENINFVTLENGIVISLHEDKIEIFNKDYNKNKIKVLENENIHSGFQLYKDGTKVLFKENNKLYSLKMK